MGVCYNDTKSKRLKREKMLQILPIIKVKFGKFETSIENITKIFSYLPEIEKMIIIINNKNIQNYLKINIGDYKRISGRYKVLEKNGTGKEYILGIDKLIFEGEYLNGKRNGKGKEYNDNGYLIFEGEYLNGKKKAGKGFEFGRLALEIEKDGKGKEYYSIYSNPLIKFEGEYKDGKGGMEKDIIQKGK